jgi:hypothetical protein
VSVSWKIILPYHEEQNDPSAPSILDTIESPDFYRVLQIEIVILQLNVGGKFTIDLSFICEIKKICG